MGLCHWVFFPADGGESENVYFRQRLPIPPDPDRSTLHPSGPGDGRPGRRRRVEESGPLLKWGLHCDGSVRSVPAGRACSCGYPRKSTFSIHKLLCSHSPFHTERMGPAHKRGGPDFRLCPPEPSPEHRIRTGLPPDDLLFFKPLPYTETLFKKLSRWNFTDRQREIVLKVIRGESNREIAMALSVTEQTVKEHLRNIFDKVEVHRRSELISRILSIPET